MQIGELCSREVIVVRPEEPLAEAAREMLQQHVGAVVVVSAKDGRTRPVGIVTDRDVVCRQLERQADLFTLTVGEVMTPDPLTVDEDSGVAEAIERMSARSARRAPVVNADGELVGIVTFDDLLPVLAEQLGALAKLIGTQPQHERRRN